MFILCMVFLVDHMYTEIEYRVVGETETHYIVNDVAGLLLKAKDKCRRLYPDRFPMRQASYE